MQVDYKDILTRYELNNPTQVIGLPGYQIRMHLHEGSSSQFLFFLKNECCFAEEDSKPLAEHLNRMQFQVADFPSVNSKYDLVLATGIINLGLSCGFSFRFLLENIATLVTESPLFSSPVKTGQEDSDMLRNARAATLLSVLSIEFKDWVPQLVSETMVADITEIDADLKLACYSALLSFLTQEKRIVGAHGSAGTLPLLNSTHISPGLPLASPGLIINPDRDLVFNEVVQLGVQCNRFSESMLDAKGQYLQALLPTVAEQQHVVDYFSNHPQRLDALYQRTFETLSGGLRCKSPHGYPDHDQRHILFSVPVTALRLGRDQDPYVQMLGTLCALAHDAGRAVEALYDLTDPRKQQVGKLHPQISTAILASILEEFPELPASVRNEVLVAVATHDSLITSHSKLARFISTCDRLQLIGPEFFLRNLYLVSCYDRGFYPAPEQVPTTSCSVFGSMAFYLHNLIPNIGSYDSLETRLRTCSGTILRLAAVYSDDFKHQFFPDSMLITTAWKKIASSYHKSNRSICLSGHERQ